MRRLLVSLALLLACSTGADAGRLHLTDGRRLADLADLAGADSTVVLLYDPGRCFSCGTTLPEWMDWRRAHPSRVRLVLTRHPTPGEARQLRAGRVVVDGVAPAAAPLVEERTSLVILLVRGREVWRGSGSPAQFFTPQAGRQP